MGRGLDEVLGGEAEGAGCDGAEYDKKAVSKRLESFRHESDYRATRPRG